MAPKTFTGEHTGKFPEWQETLAETIFTLFTYFQP